MAMSVFEAALILREFRGRHPDLATGELIETARRLRADYAAHDYVLGVELEGLVDADINGVPTNVECFFTAAVDTVIAHGEPIWARLAPAGRDRVVKAMSINGVQCLRGAGLLETPPSERVFQWWDALAAKIRTSIDERLLAQGREGERWSLDYERARLERDGLNLEPVWVAIEDNRIGYDILSYVRLDDRHANRLIEVKTSAQNPPTFILTRNEWRTAAQFGDTLEFHIWTYPQKVLRIMSVEEVRAHIPNDQGDGEWLDAEIVAGGYLAHP